MASTSDKAQNNLPKETESIKVDENDDSIRHVADEMIDRVMEEEKVKESPKKKVVKEENDVVVVVEEVVKEKTTPNVKPDKLVFNHGWKFTPSPPGSKVVHASERFPDNYEKLGLNPSELVCWLETKWTTANHLQILLIVGSTSHWRVKARISVIDACGRELHALEVKESAREATCSRVTFQGLDGQYYITMPVVEWLTAEQVAQFGKPEDRSLKVICQCAMVPVGDGPDFEADFARLGLVRYQAPDENVLASPSELRENLAALWDRGEYCDVTFHLADGSTIAAHSIALWAASDAFERMVPEGTRVVKVDQFAPEVFRAVLHFVYHDKVYSNPEPPLDRLMMAADVLQLERLRAMCDQLRYQRMDPDDALLELPQRLASLGLVPRPLSHLA